jgi:hypothetical protein
MKRLILAALLLLAFACQRRDIVTEDKVQVTFDFAGAALPASRSVVGAAEDEINSLLMLFYENGSLLPGLTVSRTPGGSSHASATVTLDIGHDYEVIAFANVTLSEYPQYISEAMSLCYTCDGIGAWTANGIPMSAYKAIHAVYAMRPVQFMLVRLASRVDLSIDTSGLMHGSLSFSSIAVKQMNRCCPYFAEGSASAATGVCDGDLASASDLEGINASGAGYSTSFYLLENMQGNILGDNSNPDHKVPERVTAAGRDPGLCTFLEITGSYADRSGHLTGSDVKAHLFLGSDAVGNFDLARNRRYTVSLTITDNGCLRTDWKIDGNLDDSRVLRFTEPEYTVGKNASVSVPLQTNLSLAEGDYGYSVSGDTRYFTVTPAAGGFLVRTSSYVTSGQSVVITVRSWDGALVSSCTVRAFFQDGPKIVVDWDNDLYVGQSGTIRIVGISGNVDPSTISLRPVNSYARVEGYGYEWKVYALLAGSDVITAYVGSVAYGNIRVDFQLPLLKFTSKRIFLPLDCTPVECGPYFYRQDGTRLYKSDFDPELYESYLAFDIVRFHSFTQRGRYWDQCGSAGNPAVELTTGELPADPCTFRITDRTYRGKTIWENYDFEGNDVELETVRAVCRNPDPAIVDATATLYSSSVGPD